MKYSFAELVCLEKVKAVAESFYRLTGIPPSITDVAGNTLVKVGWQTICTDYHRVHPKTNERCLQSDTELAKSLQKKTGYACYKCLNGLVDMAVPIVIGGEHVANLFTGQFFFEEPDRSFFKEQARKFNFDETAYLEALDKVPVFSKKKLENGIFFLSDLASLIGEMGLGQKELSELNRSLEEKVKERTLQLEEEMEKSKQAQAEKIRAGRLQGVLKMAGAAAHEFSQPLQALSFDLDFLGNHIPEPQTEIIETLKAMQENVDALSVLIGKIQNITTYEVMNYTKDQKIIDIDKASDVNLEEE